MRSIIPPHFPSLFPCTPLHHRPPWSPLQAHQLPPKSSHHRIQLPILPLPLLQVSVQLRDSSMQLPMASVQLLILSLQPGLACRCFACNIRHSIDESIEWNQGELRIK